MWKCHQLVCHDLLNVVHGFKRMTFEVEFEFQEKEVAQTQIRWVWGLWNHWNTPFGQKFVHGDGNVTGSVVVMQHPCVCNLWLDTMNPFSESFKDLTIVLLIVCPYARIPYEQHLDCWKNKLAWIWFSICSFLLSSGTVSCLCATPNFVGFGIIFENPRFITCYDLFEKNFVIFSAFKIQEHIPSVFLLFIGEVFWNQLFTNFLRAQLLDQNVNSLAIQIQLTTNHSDCQTLIRPHDSPQFGHIFLQGLPEWGSSSTLSWPPKNALCHLKTCALDNSMLFISPF